MAYGKCGNRLSELGLLLVFIQDIDYNILIVTISAKIRVGFDKMEGIRYA